MFTSLALWPLEQLLNGLLASDPHINKQLQRFAGKSLAVKGRSPDFELLLQFAPGRIQLAGQSPEALGISADAAIEGDATELAKLLLSKDSDRALANPALVFSGDASLVQNLYKTMQNLDLRWDDYLAPVLGDVLSQQASKAQKKSSQWLRHSAERGKQNLEDFLKEETRLLPHQEDLALFQEQLDALRLQIDRASARLDLLKTRTDKLSN